MENSPTKTILIVEDYAPLLNAIYLTLEASDWQLLTARDGSEAKAIIKETNIDLILTDLYMPRETGFDLLEFLRKNNKFKHIPVIVISNFNHDTDIPKLKSYKVEKWLAKTELRIKDLPAIVEIYL